jgi:RHS repeat-associated protein
VASSGAWNRAEIYAGGRHVGTYSGGPPGTTYFDHGDWLGTERVRTNTSGALYEACTGLAFGDWQACSASDPSPIHFTGKERDTESGLDFFVARYYSSSLGRFLSPDEFVGGPVSAFSAPDPAPPGPLPYADVSNPQSLNKYTYTFNNPLKYVDPDGHCVWDLCIGEATAVYAVAMVAATALTIAANRYLQSPEGQRATRAAADSITTGLRNVASLFAASEAARDSKIGDLLAGEQGRVLGEIGEISKGAAAELGYEGTRAIRDMTLATIGKLLGDTNNKLRNEKDPEKKKLLERAAEELRKAQKLAKEALKKLKKLKQEGRQTQ